MFGVSKLSIRNAKKFYKKKEEPSSNRAPGRTRRRGDEDETPEPDAKRSRADGAAKAKAKSKAKAKASAKGKWMFLFQNIENSSENIALSRTCSAGLGLLCTFMGSISVLKFCKSNQ